jgi:DNA-binding response OmpR family regulator
VSTTESQEHKETVLLVEDDVLARLVLADYLRECGYKVIEAANTDEAMTVLGQFERNIAAVLSLAAIAGKIDGFALARWVRGNRPGVEVILAANIAKAASSAGDLCEDGPMLAKPYDPSAVVERIRLLQARARQRPAK